MASVPLLWVPRCPVTRCPVTPVSPLSPSPGNPRGGRREGTCPPPSRAEGAAPDPGLVGRRRGWGAVPLLWLPRCPCNPSGASGPEPHDASLVIASDNEAIQRPPTFLDCVAVARNDREKRAQVRMLRLYFVNYVSFVRVISIKNSLHLSVVWPGGTKPLISIRFILSEGV